MKQKKINIKRTLKFMKSHGFDPDIKKIEEELKEYTEAFYNYKRCPTLHNLRLLMEETYDLTATTIREADSRGVSIYDEFERKQKMTGEKYGNV